MKKQVDASSYTISRDTTTMDVSPMDCFGLEPDFDDGEIRFLIPEGPDRGSGLLWRPEEGFTPIKDAVFDTGSGWDALRSRLISAPADMFNYADLLEELKAMTGEK